MLRLIMTTTKVITKLTLFIPLLVQAIGQCEVNVLLTSKLLLLN
jgi:hypothetical protein